MKSSLHSSLLSPLSATVALISALAFSACGGSAVTPDVGNGSGGAGNSGSATGGYVGTDTAGTPCTPIDADTPDTSADPAPPTPEGAPPEEGRQPAPQDPLPCEPSCSCVQGTVVCDDSCTTPGVEPGCAEGETKEVECNTCFCSEGAWACTERACNLGQTCGDNSPNSVACPEGQFCNHTDLSCGSTDSPGECTPKSEICTSEYDPVCGCDGKTYSNACGASGAGVSIASSGACAG